MTNVTIAKTGQAVEVDFAALPANSQEFVINYGLRQILNDCHSSVTRAGWEGTSEEFAEAIMSAVNAKLSALSTGDLTTRRGSGQPADPVEREALKIAREELTAAVKAKGKRIKQIENFDELVKAHADKNEERLMKEARARIKASATKAEAVDLEALGL